MNHQAQKQMMKTEFFISAGEYFVRSRNKSGLWSGIVINNIASVERGNYCPAKSAVQESSSTASKTSDEKFRLTKTLFSIASMLSSKQTLSCLMRLLSDVGLMTMMRGTPWGDMGSADGIFPKFRESKELLLGPLTLSLTQPSSSPASEILLVRLWLRLLVRTSRGRVAMVRELETRSCSQVLGDSLMVEGCW